MVQGTTKVHEVETKVCGADKNPHRPQAILEKAHKIDRKCFCFKGECSNVVMDSHIKGGLLSIYV